MGAKVATEVARSVSKYDATSFRRDTRIKLNALFDYVLKTELSNVNEWIFNQFTIDFFAISRFCQLNRNEDLKRGKICFQHQIVYNIFSWKPWLYFSWSLQIELAILPPLPAFTPRTIFPPQKLSRRGEIVSLINVTGESGKLAPRYTQVARRLWAIAELHNSWEEGAESLIDGRFMIKSFLRLENCCAF